MLDTYFKDYCDAVGQARVTLIKRVYEACFATTEDQLAFELKHGLPNLHPTALWTYTRLTPDDIVPSAIFLTGEQVIEMVWFNDEKRYHRPRDCGPSLVKINLHSGKCTGFHYEDDEFVVTPAKPWRKHARRHNHWLRLLDD